MFPLLPSQISPKLEQLVLDVLSASTALGKGVHPLLLQEIAHFMEKVNSYYTNAMEGNPSKLKDIEAALSHRLSKDSDQRNFQLEHVAHIQVQEEMLRRLREEPDLNICSQEFLCWLHREFYLKLPPEMRCAKTVSGRPVFFEPGDLRDQGVTVGMHQDSPEKREDIISCLDNLSRSLNPADLSGVQKVVGMAASHHRLLWIHPFADGNGRVARLFTDAYGVRIGLGDPPLWSVSRAFARRRREYDRHLALADQPRRNDLDGRGPLSEENLVQFCHFFLDSCKDQILYMRDVLRLEELERRYVRYLTVLVDEKSLSRSGSKVMLRLFLSGKVGRSEVSGICRVERRRASQIIKELLGRGLVRSRTVYGPLELNISVDMAALLFPELT